MKPKSKAKPPKTETLGVRNPGKDLLALKKVIKDLFIGPRTCWSPLSVRFAREQHDLGQFMQSGRLVDEMMTDGWIYACNNTLVYGVLGLHEGWKWKGDYVPTNEDLARLSITNKWWESFLASSAPATMLKWVVNIGVSVVTKAWNLTDGIYIPDVHVVHPSNVWVNQVTGVYYIQTYTHGLIELDPSQISDPRLQLVRHVDSERPWIQGAVRPLGLIWMDKQCALSDWRSYLSVFGNPLRVLTTDRENSTPPETDIETFIETLANAITYGAPVHLMNGQKLDLLQADANNADAFSKKIDQCNKEISLVYLGQNLTTDITGGSLAASKVHENVKADYIELFTTILNRALNEIVAQFYEYNFESGVEVPMAFFNPAQPQNELNLAEIKQKSALGLQQLGNALDDFTKVLVDGKPLIDSIDLEKLLNKYGVEFKS